MVQNQNSLACLTNLIVCDRQTLQLLLVGIPLLFLLSAWMSLRTYGRRQRCVKKIPMPEDSEQVIPGSDVVVRVQQDTQKQD